MKVRLPDGRPYIDGVVVEPNSRRLMRNGHYITNEECFAWTNGTPIRMVKFRMSNFGLTAEEAINLPPPKGKYTKIMRAKMERLVKEFRRWKREQERQAAPSEESELVEPAPEEPKTNGNLPAVATQRLEIVSVAPADVSLILTRLDTVERLLKDLLAEWGKP